MTKRRQFSDFETSDKRTIALRIYVNKGEKNLIDTAIKESERIPDRSAWASRVLLETACSILGIEYPYKK